MLAPLCSSSLWSVDRGLWSMICGLWYVAEVVHACHCYNSTCVLTCSFGLRFPCACVSQGETDLIVDGFIDDELYAGCTDI